MAQNKYIFAVDSNDEYTPNRQPIEVQFNLATTSTSDSGRNQFGYATNNVLFTVEAYKITFPKLDKTDMSGILQAIKGKPSFKFHYFSPYYGSWRDDYFYVANIESTKVFVKDDYEWINGLTFQITGVNPV